MSRILKLELQLLPYQTIQIEGFPINLMVQNDKPVIYWICRGGHKTNCKIKMINTGSAYEANPKWSYLGTIMLYGGSYVKHVFISIGGD